MKMVTALVTKGSIMQRALQFANMKGRIEAMTKIADATAVCAALKVLPPGAPYRIDQAGRAYGRARPTRREGVLIRQRPSTEHETQSQEVKTEQEATGSRRTPGKGRWREPKALTGHRVPYVYRSFGQGE